MSPPTSAFDGSEESMSALRWALNNLNLRSPSPGSTDSPGSFVVLHVQPPPSRKVVHELKESRKWAGLHAADNSCFHYRRVMELELKKFYDSLIYS